MNRKIRNLTFFGLGSFIVLVLLAFGLYLPYWRAYALVHPQRSPWAYTPADLGLTDTEEIRFPTTDGLQLAAWYLPPQNDAVIIFVHGLGGNRSELLLEASFLHRQGYGALLLDLRNHGQSQGEKTTLGLNETRDIAAALAYIRQREGADTAVAVFGHSMGAATVLLATAQFPEIQAVIAESPFTSVEDNISNGVRILTGLPPEIFAPMILFFGQREAGVDISAVRPIDVIASISPRAVLLIHGARDETLPAQNSYQLYEAARDPKELYILENVGHGGFLDAEPTEYPHRIITFLGKYLRP